MKIRTRIFFFNRFFWPDQSATAQILTDLCRELDAAGYQITVVSSRLDYSNRTIQYKDNEKMGGVDVVRLWSTRFGRGTIIGRLFDYLTIYYSFFAYILRNLGPQDIVILKTDPPLLSILGALGREVKQFRLVAWCQDIFPEVAMDGLQAGMAFNGIFRMLKLIRDWSLHRSDRVVVLGRDMRNYLSGREIAPQNLVIIPNWSVQDENHETSENQMRKDWGINQDALVVGYSGNLGRAHDWETILAVAGNLSTESRILFFVCGGGFGYEQLRKAVADNNLEEKFLFQPYQLKEQLASSLRVPDIHWFTLKEVMTPYIFPSKFYGILQAGRPVIFIGDSQSELATIIEQEGIGCSVREGDDEGLIGYIQKICQNPDLLIESGKSARQLWEDRFQRSKEVAKWQGMLQEIECNQC